MGARTFVQPDGIEPQGYRARPFPGESLRPRTVVGGDVGRSAEAGAGLGHDAVGELAG